MSSAKTLLIVYHSLTGGTRQMAEAARSGSVAEAGCAVRLLHAAQAGPGDVLGDGAWHIAQQAHGGHQAKLGHALLGFVSHHTHNG